MEILNTCKRCGAKCCKLFFQQELFAINLEPFETFLKSRNKFLKDSTAIDLAAFLKDHKKLALIELLIGNSSQSKNSLDIYEKND